MTEVDYTGLTDQQLKAIGSIMVCCARLEQQIEHSIWVFLSIKSGALMHEGRAVTDSLRTSSKKDLFKRLANLRINSAGRTKGKEFAQQLRAELHATFSMLSEVISLRDALAHGTFQQHRPSMQSTETVILKWKINPSNKLVTTEITMGQLLAAPRQAWQATVAVSKFAKHFDRLNQRPTSP